MQWTVISNVKWSRDVCTVALCNNRPSHFVIKKSVALCNKLEIDGRRTSKPSNMCDHRQHVLLQSATGITKCDDYHKVRQLFHYKVRQVLLQNATGISKCDNFITKFDSTDVSLVLLTQYL